MVACPGLVGLEKEGLGLGLSSSSGGVGDGDEVSRVLEGLGSGVSQSSIGIAPHPSSDLLSSDSWTSVSAMLVQMSTHGSVSTFPFVHVVV
jgi:hypothetical protein